MRQRFDQFMQEALYHPERGYYTQGEHNVGKKGDFFTSVSVGNLFGHLLCQRFFSVWQECGKPNPFYIAELGGNNGQLAADILDYAPQLSPEFSQSIDYTLIEPLTILHTTQHNTTRNRARSVHSITEAPIGTGVVFGNELLDAFPVRLATVRKNTWHELYVHTAENTSPVWEEDTTPLPTQEGQCPPCHAATLPEGYTTEWNDTMDSFFEDIVVLRPQGLFLFIDYGRPQHDYYSPQRTQGTLRTYHQHTRTDNPLINVGEQDITADVNFTQVALAAQKQGLTPLIFTDQAHWLTSLAKPSLLMWQTLPTEERMRRITQFQTLTHPTHMGHQFHILELAAGKISPPPLIGNRTPLGALF